MSFDTARVRACLDAFDFRALFIEALQWSLPSQSRKLPMDDLAGDFERRQIAQLAGVAVFEVTSAADTIPDAETCDRIHRKISQAHHENLLIFLGAERTQSLWYWVKREGSRRIPRRHYYFKGQPGDLFISKLSSMFVDIGELEEDNLTVAQAAARLQNALDIEQVTKKFYNEFKDERLRFIEHIHGIDNENDRRWYASVLLNRMMFIYFLQRKFFVDGGDERYLQHKLEQSQARGADLYYSDFLNTLFFEGFAKPEEKRSDETRAKLGQVPYLNGGLFIPHPVEERCPNIHIEDKAFENLLALFERFSWNLDDTPGGKDNEINPDVLGYIFEKYINQKAFGAYYTRPEITEYLCEQTIYRVILDKVNVPAVPGLPAPPHYESIENLLMNLDAGLCRRLIRNILPTLSLLDPACGSGAFLVAAMKTLIYVYSAVIGKIPFLNDRWLTDWLHTIQTEHRSLNYYVKRQIITDNLFGVDIMDEACEIAKLRLFLALVSSVQTVDQLEPLPNIDFNILPGNSLIGLMHVDDADFNNRHAQGSLFRKSFREVLDEKNRLIKNYRNVSTYAKDLQSMRDAISEKKEEAAETLNDILLEEFKKCSIKFEQATWDEAAGREGKPQKRPLTIDDIEALKPFHWGYEFDEVLNTRGGFDAIITNPPWEIFKPIAKEFCYDHDSSIERRGTNIQDFEAKLTELLKVPTVREQYLDYLSCFPHVSAFYRSARQYENQISIVNGKKAGTDINVYKLFTEQCYNLLRDKGQCGIVIPSGIYTDLGTKQLREMFFTQTRITGLFCFENRREIFEKVDSRFKFVVLTFCKADKTETFPAAFMRHDVEELATFPKQGALDMSVEMVRRLSPDSLSIMEFKSEMDVQIAEKMLRFPLLGEKIADKWNLILSNEFHMTNDSKLFRTSPAPGRLPLYEGKMIWHFTHGLSTPRYLIDEKQAATELLSPRLKAVRKQLKEAGNIKEFDGSQMLMGYQQYRLGFRAVTGATNERALVVTVIPRFVFAGNSLIVSVPAFDRIVDGQYQVERAYTAAELLACTSLMASFVCDWYIRQKILTNMNMFYVYQIPVPRLTEEDPRFAPIVNRAARLICTTPEFDDLAREVGMNGHQEGATDATERARLRAELDGLIAHLYGLTEEEFVHILGTFPLVAAEVKQAALAAYRAFAPHPDDRQLAELIRGGEGHNLEFKIAARWNPHRRVTDDTMKENIVQGVAAYMNAYEGGALVIGVDRDTTVVGLADDYPAVDARNPGRDTYERFLRNMLNDQLGAACVPFYSIRFHPIEGKEVCRIRVEPSSRPVFVNGEMYIRDGNGKRKLSAQQAIDYQRQRWKTSP